MTQAAAVRAHPAEIFARRAAAGEIPVSRWVSLAARRHLADLQHGHERGLYFDPRAGQESIDFFGFLRHSKGEWAGQEFELQPWQEFILWSIFGWKKSGGVRRFTNAFVEVARKNGKSTLCAGIGLFLFFGDGEPGAEVYCAATKKDQARIVFSEATRMRDASPGLKKRIQKFRDNMSIVGTASKFEPLGADKDTIDGLNVHGAIVDELHAHKKRKLLDDITTATGARRSPLVFRITTAGSDQNSVCWTEHDYAVKVLEGVKTDDTLFVFVASLDPDDDPFDEKNWIKANPNLAVSVKLEDLRGKANKAKQEPSSRNSFLRLHLNVWTTSEIAAIDPEEWKLCVGYSLTSEDPVALRRRLEAELAGQKCFIGVDLSATEDITAEVKLFPPAPARDRYVALCNFWLPKENLKKKMLQWREPYDVWMREGFIRGTEGTTVDYDVIREQIRIDVERFDLVELAYDPWNATQFANSLVSAGFDEKKLVKFSQTLQFYAEPTKKFLEELIPTRKIAHLADPVLRWMATNLIVYEDPNGNKRPKKQARRGKIDGIVALLMALGRSISKGDAGPSVYETRGVLTL